MENLEERLKIMEGKIDKLVGGNDKIRESLTFI